MRGRRTIWPILRTILTFSVSRATPMAHYATLLC